MVSSHVLGWYAAVPIARMRGRRQGQPYTGREARRQALFFDVMDRLQGFAAVQGTYLIVASFFCQCMLKATAVTSA